MSANHGTGTIPFQGTTRVLQRHNLDPSPAPEECRRLGTSAIPSHTSIAHMETSSLHLDRELAGGKQQSTSGMWPNMQEATHETTYTAPRGKPVDIVVPSTLPSPAEDHVLKVVQQPEIAKVAAPREKGKSTCLSLLPLPSTNHEFVCSSNTA
ncbi:MAG: hypothetical protein AUG51_14015 [Acidobacteria bacterium 13_1_20CM_3_53_8]|nr:MAG: hypothetical protein AUG51_14015 [Acidobacteria bacterium 13_1_20CM_3_53_8]